MVHYTADMHRQPRASLIYANIDRSTQADRYRHTRDNEEDDSQYEQDGDKSRTRQDKDGQVDGDSKGERDSSGNEDNDESQWDGLQKRSIPLSLSCLYCRQL